MLQSGAWFPAMCLTSAYSVVPLSAAEILVTGHRLLPSPPLQKASLSRLYVLLTENEPHIAIPPGGNAYCAYLAV